MRAATYVLPWLMLAGAVAQADEAAPAEYKFTTGVYHFSDHTTGLDLNLRRSADNGNTWIGYYRSAGQEVTQWRAGWDHSYGQTWRVSPSIQVASFGFVGGSVQLETGDPWFAGVGLGRTNLKPYVNLNFDPNDAWMLSAGRRRSDNQLLMVQLIRDNRQNPDQQHLHFLLREPLPDGQRISVDVLYKTGLVEDVRIHRWGLTLTYDHPHWFARFAWDPKANFTPADMLRVQVGTRF